MKGRIWIVPEETLEAIKFEEGKAIEVTDQTVWVVDEYRNGYFWGTSYTAINGVPKSKMSFIGSIASNGKVLISFNNQNTSVTGIGTYKNKKFTMQMNNLIDLQNNNIILSHWSYMISVNKNSYYYHHLPSLNISVPKFISLFN